MTPLDEAINRENLELAKRHLKKVKSYFESESDYIKVMKLNNMVLDIDSLIDKIKGKGKIDEKVQR